MPLRADYIPVNRSRHSTIKSGDYIYIWGGVQPELPEVHNNEKKKLMSSVVEVFHSPTGIWCQKSTTGSPPLGVYGYASIAVGNEIFYFGGYCNHDYCYHNSLYSLNLNTFHWKELYPTSNNGPMMKSDAAMAAVQLSGKNYLAVIGGYGPLSNNIQLNSQYSSVKMIPGLQHCNEIHYYSLLSGKWTSPSVAGDRLPPVDSFTLTSVSESSAVLFGGDTANGYIKKMFLISFATTSVVISEILNPGGLSKWPKERQYHSTVLIHSSSGPHMLLIGGVPSSDCWLFDINKRIWKQLMDLPDVVTGRWWHSLAAWTVTLSASWIIVFGGVGISDTMAVIELRHSNNEWAVSMIPMEQYECKLKASKKAINDTMKNWCSEGFMHLTVTRVQMLGPPGSGKTCAQHLLLNEDPPFSTKTEAFTNDSQYYSTSHKSITDSSPIACKAVKASRIAIDDDETWKRITRDELLERLASSLKNEAKKQNRIEVSSVSSIISENTNKAERKKQLGAETTNEDKSKLTASSANKDKMESAGNTENDIALESQEEYTENPGLLEKIIELIPLSKAQLSDKWIYIIDSGGQPAFQELLPLFTRACSLNVITLNISKPLDEESDYLYQINGESFLCDQKLKYTNCKHFKSTVLSGASNQKLNLPCVIEHPEHSMYFVLGTHYDEFERTHQNEVEIRLTELNEKLMSSLPPNVVNKYIIHNVPQLSIIFPVNTLLPAKSQDREEASKHLSNAISKRSEVSLEIKVPIRWFAFELQLERKAESKGLNFITKKEAINEGKIFHMNATDVEEALQYLHNCTIILYYPEVKPELVFVNPQVILDVLSHLLALTYINDQTALSLVQSAVTAKERRDLVHGNFKEALLKKFKVFSGEFKPEYFINLLKYLHIITELSNDTYFLPCALPAFSDTCNFKIPETTIKPLRLVWRMKENKWESKVNVLVPQGSFHLMIVHLFNQKGSAVICFNNSNGVKQFRDVASLLISFTKGYEPTEMLYLVNCKEYIEIAYNGPTKHCPKVRDLVTKAISDSVKAINALCGDLHLAFACQNNKRLCCLVNEDDTKLTFCPSYDGHKCALDETHLCWFDSTSSAFDIKNSQNNGDSDIGSFRSDVAYNVMTKCTKMLKEDLSLDSLIDKLVEKRMINDSEKRQVLDERCGLTTDQRMEKVLNFVKASIRRDGEDFGLFIEIIKEEDTRRADRVIKKLLDTYNNIS